MARRPAQSPRLQQTLAEADRALGEGRYELAESLAARALAVAPRAAPALALRAAALVRLRRYDEAEADITAAIRAAPAPPAAWLVTLSHVRRGQGRLEEALATLERARALPGDPQPVLSGLAEILATLRRYPEAHEVLASAVAHGADRPGLLAQYGRVCRALGRAAEAVGPLRAAASRESLPPLARQHVLFELGHVLDVLARYDEAFEAFARANALERRAFDIDRHGAITDEIIRSWTRDALAGLPCCAELGRGLVLIVGMRRSGTTLAEQIIAAHPQAAAGGELPWLRELALPLDPESIAPLGLLRDLSRLDDQSIRAVGEAYRSRADGRRGAARVFTDKMPANFKLLGLAQLALGGVAAVWCRRDPLDTCLSCFMQPFNDNSYCADLRTLARYWHDCDRLMRHWQEHLEIPIVELRYEELVRDPGPHTRRLLEALGLPFDEACLRFHEAGPARTASTDQVARPLYTSSIARADAYRAHLAPLVDELRRLGHTIESL